MSLDIGEAFREGVSRTFQRNGLVLAGVFVGIALLTVVLTHTFIAASFEAMLETFQGFSPGDFDGELTQEELDETIAELEAAQGDIDEFAPFALSLPVSAAAAASIAAAGLLVTALLAEATSIVAVRVFATDETETVSSDLVTDNILLATLNGFIGGIVVWGLIIIGSVFFLLPGIILAVLFYFLRQEIALKDKNFVQAMADSWRATKGYRIEVFLVAALVSIISLFDVFVGGLVGFAFTTVGEVLTVLVGGLLTVFGAAVVTRAYVQIDEAQTETEIDDGDDRDDDAEDPYAKALGPDDIPK